MSQDLNDHVIVGIFDGAEQADAGAAALMAWDKANEEIKLGTIGRLILDEDGKVKSKRYGSSRTRRGAVVGSAIGLVAGALTGGLSLLAGVVAGGAVGGATGALTKGSLGLTDVAVAQIKTELGAGRAALVVLCDDPEIKPTMAEIEKAGGKAQSFGVSSKVLDAMVDAGLDEDIENERWRTLYTGM